MQILFHIEEMLRKDAVERAPLLSHGYVSGPQEQLEGLV